MSAIDLSIVALYFIAILSVGIWKGRNEKEADGFFVGNRQVPWIAVLGSIVATEVSAATFLGTPGAGFSSNMNYLQFGLGSILARFFIAAVFLTAFYKANCVSIYQYLEQRFGPQSQFTASIFFIITRLMASGVRLMIAATGFSVILDWPLWLCIIGFTALALLYTSIGGIKAVIWTDCIQAIVFISAGLACLWFLQSTLGWSHIWEVGKEAGRFEVFRFQPQGETITWKDWFNDSNLFFIAIIFGLINTTAALGTDQDLTQRMLTCKNVQQAQRSVILSGLISLPIAAVFLSIGVGLYVYYSVYIDPTLPENGDKVFPHFIKTVAPAGLKGLLLTGVLAAAMSSLDSAMAALSSSAVKDLLTFGNKETLSDKAQLSYSRWSMLVFAVLLASIAWFLKDGGQFLWLSFKLAGITYSSLLGIFLLGTLTKRGYDRLNVIAMIAGSVIVSVMLYLSTREVLPLAWTWLILCGVLITFGIGFLGQKR